jgi:hypothetical protein
VLAPFGSESLRHADDAEFRGAIGDMLFNGDGARLRGQVDDFAAFASRDHRPADRLGDEEGALQVNVDSFVPVIQRQVFRRCEEGDAGAVDGNVDPAKGRNYIGDSGLDRGRIGDIADKRSVISSNLDCGMAGRPTRIEWPPR